MSAAGKKNPAIRVSALVVLATMCMLLLPASGAAAAAPPGPSTFDLYAPMLSNTVPGAPSTTAFEFKVRSIFPDLFTVNLSTASSSPYLTPVLDRKTVLVTRIRSQVTMLLRIKSAGAPQGTEGWVTVTASRGSESHVLRFRVKVQDAGPELQLGSKDGAMEQKLRLSDGSPFEVNLKAANKGATKTVFPLSSSAPAGWAVSFSDTGGNPIDHLEVKGVIPQIEFPPLVKFKATIDPPANFPETPATSVTIKLGDAPLSLEVARQGVLWSPNDMGGLYPHVHQVRRGGTTTYKVYVKNLTAASATYSLAVSGAPSGWTALLGRRSVVVPAGGTRAVTLALKSPKRAAAGQAADVRVEARGAGMRDTVSLAARVNNTPKVYYFSIDSMSYNYLTYNADGTGPGSDGDWLMPNIHDFMEDSVAYENATALMPAATDMNHTSALSGCYPGTEGIYCVSMTFGGTDSRGRMATQPTSLDHAWTVEDGADVKVQRIYEFAKQKNPEALCAFLSNKSWLVDLQSDPRTQTAVERSVSSEQRPAYIPPVEKFVLGDPPSDRDPLRDPMQKSMLVMGASHLITEKLPPGTTDPDAVARPVLNLLAPFLFTEMDELLRFLMLPANVGVGGNPQGFCDDSYIGDSLLSLIEQEDPDVTYCNLGELDETGHVVGSAEDPSEWDDQGTEEARDDESAISDYALRDDAIDVARQADIIFARFTGTLKKRGVYDSSIIVMLADHGMHNYKRPEKGYEVLDNRGLLRSKGFVMGTDYDYDMGAMDYDLIFSRDKKNIAAIEKILEEYTIEDPVDGAVHPMVVFNREEMKTGIDTANPDLRVNPGEFFSEYWVNRDSASAETMKWPDLIAYTTGKYYTRIYADAATEGANAMGIKAEINLPAELSLMTTGGHISFDTTHVPLVYKGPGVTKGARVKQKVYLSDIAPTIYTALGWTIPGFVDGKPLPLK